MKLNRMKDIALSGSALFLMAIAAISCDDANDWTTDSSYNRLFSVPKMSVSANATDGELTWTTTPKTEYYVIEVSQDSLYDDIAMGSGKGSIIFGQDKSITKSPYVMEGLSSDTKYFVRMKGYSANTSESTWGYMTDFSFKTRTEQIISKWAISYDKITLEWPAGSAADRVEITDATNNVIKNVTLTGDNVEEGTITINGLSPVTAYTAILYKGESKRGMVTFTTTAKVPDAEYTAWLQMGDSLNNDLFTTMAEAGYKKVNVALPAGGVYYNENTINIPDGLSVTFFGISGGAQPVISVKSFDYAGTHDFITFENINLTGSSKKADGSNTTLDYIFNQSKAATVKTIEFSNSTIQGFKNTPFRMQGSDEKVVTNLLFNNCMVYGAESRTYSLIHIDASNGNGKAENIQFNRSTVVYTGKCFIYCKNTDFTSLKFEDCTFSKIIGLGDYFVDCAKNTYGPSAGTTITNCIFGSTSVALAEGQKINGIRAKGNISVTNSYSTSDLYINSSAIENLTPYDGGEKQLFNDANNRDFTIIDNGFAGKTNAGDPRWYLK